MAGSVCLPFTPTLHFTKPKTSLGLAVNRKSFMDSVDRVLAVSGRFTLNGRLRVDSDHTNRWRRNVMNNGVLDYCLKNTVSESQVLDVFASKTLENLKLNGSTCPMLPDDTSLPSLKSLSLSYVRFSNLGVFERLISACPSLEELNIRVRTAREFWRLSHILSCPTLKRLSITSFSSFELGSISFDFPNLVYLYYFDFVQREYPVVKFDSLVEAKLDLRLIYGDSEDPSNLFKGLRNVEKLGLSFPDTFEVIVFLVP